MTKNQLSNAQAVLDESIQDIDLPRQLPPELEPVPAFPLDALPESIYAWVKDVSTRMCCPHELVALPMFVALGSLAARKVAVRPQENTDWTESPNIWGITVGRPGLMKSPAQGAALSAMRALEAASGQVYADSLSEYEKLMKVQKLKEKAIESRAYSELKKNPNSDIFLDASDTISKPHRKRFVVNNLTYESAGEILAENIGGVLLERDELAGFLKNLSNEEQSEARSFYLQSWSGGPYLFDRIGRGHIRIDDLRLSIIGGIQPGPISRLINQANRYGSDGLIERFLIVWPDEINNWHDIDVLPNMHARSDAFSTFEHLNNLDPVNDGACFDESGRRQVPYLRFDTLARYLFLDWRQELEGRLRTQVSSGMFESALSKFRKHVPALALIIHLAERRRGAIGVSSITKALQLADFFEAHATRAYGAAVRPIVRVANLVLKKLQSGALEDGFTCRRIYRSGWESLTDREQVEAGVEMLVDHGWLSEAKISEGGRGTVLYNTTIGAKISLAS